MGSGSENRAVDLVSRVEEIREAGSVGLGDHS
jgi:hypothetical protein